MSNYKIYDELQAVIVGVFLKHEGLVVNSKLNKVLARVGIDRVNRNESKCIVDNIRNDSYLNDSKNKAVKGEVLLEDLRDVEDKQVFKGNDYNEAISSYVVPHADELSRLREDRKTNRQTAYPTILFDELTGTMVNELKGIPLLDHKVYKYTSTEEEEEDFSVLLSDFHVGISFQDLTNESCFHVLKRRLNQLLQETIKDISKRGISNVTQTFVGDLIEHVPMRNLNQAFETEFTMAEQLAKGTRLLLDFLTELSTYEQGSLRSGMIAGNHDRVQGNNNQKVYNDSVAYSVLDSLLLLTENGVLEGIEIIDNSKGVYGIKDTVCNLNILINQKDGLKGKGKHIPKFTSNNNNDLSITGHVHHFSVTQDDYNRMHIVASSPCGYNNYAKELHLSRTKPSQQLLFLSDKNKDIDIKPVFLD
ncbi:DNA repair exonuclease [Staphylococcus phage vB_SauH_DELF3]|nr:DNA repair exonuclease [Staphylococcus phage vB_SauH_DELF3]